MAKAKKAETVAEVFNSENLLRRIVEATNGPVGYGYGPVKEMNDLAIAGLVEINETLTNDEGEIAARATQKGIESFMGEATETKVEAPAEERPVATSNGGSYPVVADIPIPRATRGRAKAQKFPFDSLLPGQSFFLPDGPDYEASKKYASTVSSATAKYAVPDPENTRVKKTLKRGEDGKALVIDGVRQYNEETVPAHKLTRQFIIRAVADGAPWGQPGVKGAGVWRTV